MLTHDEPDAHDVAIDRVRVLVALLLVPALYGNVESID